MELVMLTRPNCSGCRMLKRKLKSEEVEDVTIIDVADTPEAIDTYRIDSAPVLLLMDEGEEVSRIVGYDPKKQEDDVDEFISQLD